jgi:hypothetical protein
MSRRWYDVDYTVAQVQMSNALRPRIESKESAHGRQIWRDDLYIWQRGELPVASVMIAVFMGVHDEQGKANAVLGRQKGKDRLRQWYLVWIRDGASVNQKSLFGSDEQVEKVRFRVGARILP